MMLYRAKVYDRTQDANSDTSYRSIIVSIPTCEHITFDQAFTMALVEVLQSTDDTESIVSLTADMCRMR